MHKTIGAFDAKATLSALLKAVKMGDRYTITVRGQAVADLIPSAGLQRENIKHGIASMQNIVKVEGVSTAELKSFIEEGRK